MMKAWMLESCCLQLSFQTGFARRLSTCETRYYITRHAPKASKLGDAIRRLVTSILRQETSSKLTMKIPQSMLDIHGCNSVQQRRH